MAAAVEAALADVVAEVAVAAVVAVVVVVLVVVVVDMDNVDRSIEAVSCREAWSSLHRYWEEYSVARD